MAYRGVCEGGGVSDGVLLPTSDLAQDPPHDLAGPGLGEVAVDDEVRGGDGADGHTHSILQGPTDRRIEGIQGGGRG